MILVKSEVKACLMILVKSGQGLLDDSSQVRCQGLLDDSSQVRGQGLLDDSSQVRGQGWEVECCQVRGQDQLVDCSQVIGQRSSQACCLAQTHADVKYICHYPGPGDKLEDLIPYESPQCMKQNKDALNKEEKANKKYPYYFYNIGIAVGCIAPRGLGNLSDGEWICQGDTKKYIAVGIVPVYHSCWPVCNENYTLSVPLRDFRCTEKQTWDADATGIICRKNDTDHSSTPTPKNELLDNEMHIVFVACGCVVILIVIGFVSYKLLKICRTKTDYSQNSNDSSRQQLLDPDSLHVKVGTGSEQNISEDEVNKHIEMRKIRKDKLRESTSNDSGCPQEDLVSFEEDINNRGDCKAEIVDENFDANEQEPKYECNLKISEVEITLFTELGYLLDPTEELIEQKTWIGFARNVLRIKDEEIKSRIHHYRGDHNNGYFTNMRDGMTANGLFIGDIVKYYSREENLRKDVLKKISESHKGCPSSASALQVKQNGTLSPNSSQTTSPTSIKLAWMMHLRMLTTMHGMEAASDLHFML
ncbi:hypothetical protein FSP39_022945 [Pinctada imbricata]|uniref:Uncharacterized protein n=1 Tax=Pinctada imbricata TaxID=66713 RepID=A0AA89C9A7_PINIB|nr:hypothetical protein FSP39_022945 [Pinctada imbricata]